MVAVATSLALALILAGLLARMLSRPLLPIIIAAHSLGSGQNEGPIPIPIPIPIPRDRDLAVVAKALNEMALRAADSARQTAQAQLLGQVLSSQEGERRRVARELHDELGQSLSALLLAIQNLPREVDSDNRAELEHRVISLIDEVRRMAWGLRPSILDDHGLERAVARLCEEIASRNGLPVDCESVGFEKGPRLPEAIEIVLYRVAQEAIHNAVRHAEASRLSVVLVRGHVEVTLLVEDDGKGFEPNFGASQGRRSLGLLGMRERVALVRGTLDIRSDAGEGASVRARIPLPGGAS